MPYIAYMHTHVTLVIIYLLLFLIKLILLLVNNKDALARFRKKTRVVGDMVVPTLFLVTGVIMAYKAPYVAEQSWFIVKLVLLVLAIVLGIITFKRNSKVLGIITLVLFVYIYGISETKSPVMKSQVKALGEELQAQQAENIPQEQLGAKVYSSMRCYNCHGEEGNKGIAGAANLQQSTMSDEELIKIISNGKNNMPAYSKALNEQEIKAVAEYVKTFRK